MAKINVGINGFGRIGRLVARAIFEHHPEIEIKAINDLTSASTLAHLFKHDSTQGKFKGDVRVVDGHLVVNGKKIDVSADRDPANLRWAERGVDYVIECTGFFTKEADARKHITAGAKKVIISAPATGDNVVTVVIGVNDNKITKDVEIFSNASCTTNCLAPMVKVLDDKFGVVKGFMTTIHAYTGDQMILDAPHKDLRRARAAAVNIVPTSTGAAKAVGLVLPHLKGKLDGGAVRVPVPTGSLTDFTCEVSKETTLEEVQAAFKAAANGPLKGILEFSEEPLVSTDIIGDTHSCIYDSELTKVSGKMVKVIGWYDNEAGYSARTAEIIKMIAAAN